MCQFSTSWCPSLVQIAVWANSKTFIKDFQNKSLINYLVQEARMLPLIPEHWRAVLIMLEFCSLGLHFQVDFTYKFCWLDCFLTKYDLWPKPQPQSSPWWKYVILYCCCMRILDETEAKGQCWQRTPLEIQALGDRLMLTVHTPLLLYPNLEPPKTQNEIQQRPKCLPLNLIDLTSRHRMSFPI